LAKHLTKRHIDYIVNLIRGWSDAKITWKQLCIEAKPLIGKLASRQSLQKHTEIYNAYIAKKKGLVHGGPIIKRPASLKVAAESLAKKDSIILELKEQVRGYKQQFTIWQYNAYKHGLTERQLNQPMPRIDREG